MSWNKEAAVSYLRSHALGHSHSECAKFTRLAILAGGVKVPNTDYAKDYGAQLLRAGFSELPPGSTLISGDVAVIQPYPGGNGIGHMTVHSGFLTLFKKACIRGLGTAKCNHPLKFTGCTDEKDIFIIRYAAGGM
ncbi:hypothetical protein [Enterobacter asburiae]|uniref:hypothetical protein n=1 Tax=Enterobacter asburiae TaxID=61645 RepID=UPI003F67CCE5